MRGAYVYIFKRAFAKARMTEEEDSESEESNTKGILSSKITRREAVSTMATAGAVVAGLVVGGAAGYFAGSSVAKPAATETVTSTQTATATAAAQTVTQTVSASAVSTNALAGQTLNLGLIEPLSGPFSVFGTSIQNGAKYLVNQINSSGGIAGAQINLIVEDSKSDAATAATAATQLITVNKVLAIAGIFASDEAEAATEVTEKYGIPFLHTGASAAELFTRGYRYEFRWFPSQLTKATYSVTWVADNVASKNGGPLNVCVLNENSAMGTDNANWVVPAIKGAGMNLLAPPFMYSAPTITDFSPIISKMQGLSPSPDVVFICPYYLDAALAVKQSAGLGFSPIWMGTGGAGFMLSQLITAIGPASEGILTNIEYSNDVSDPGVQAFVTGFNSAYGYTPQYWEECGYMGVYAFKLGVEGALTATGQVTSENIRNAVASLLAPNTASGTEPGILKYTQAGELPDFIGSAMTRIMQVQNGKWATIYWPAVFPADQALYGLGETVDTTAYVTATYIPPPGTSAKTTTSSTATS